MIFNEEVSKNLLDNSSYYGNRNFYDLSEGEGMSFIYPKGTDFEHIQNCN